MPGRKMSPKNVTSPPKIIQKPMKKHDFLPIGVHKKNWTLKWTFFAKIFKFFNFGRMSSAAPSAPAGFRLRVLVVCSLHVSMRVDGHCHLQGPPTQISGPTTVRTHGPRLFKSLIFNAHTDVQNDKNADIPKDQTSKNPSVFQFP